MIEGSIYLSWGDRMWFIDLRGHGDCLGIDLSKNKLLLQRKAKTPTQYMT